MAASLENAATEVQPTNPLPHKQHPCSSSISDQPEAANANSFPIATLSDVMSEQLAQEVQEEESYTPASQPEIASHVGASASHSQEQCVLSEEQNVEEQRETDKDMLSLEQMAKMMRLQKKKNRGGDDWMENLWRNHPEMFDSDLESDDFIDDAYFDDSDSDEW